MTQPDPKVIQSPTSDTALVASSAIIVEQPLDRPLTHAATPSISDRVVSAFPDAPVMVRIARAESNMIPSAKNKYSTATGLFQVLKGTATAYHCGDQTIVEESIKCARKIYDAEGTTPWISSSAAWKQ